MMATDDRAARLRARFAPPPSAEAPDQPAPPPIVVFDEPQVPSIQAVPAAHHRYSRRTYYIRTDLAKRLEAEQVRLTKMLGSQVAKSHLLEEMMAYGLEHMDELEERVLDRARQ